MKKVLSEKTNKKKGVSDIHTNNSRKNPLHSVGMKLFLIFFICIVTFVSVVGFMAFKTSKEIIQEQVADASLQTIVMARQNVDNIYKKFEEFTMQFILDQDFQTLVRDYTTATNTEAYERLQMHQSITDELQNKMLADNTIASIQLYNLDGSSLLNSNVGIEDNSIKESEWFQTAVDNGGSIHWIPQFNSTEQTDNYFALSRLIKDVVTSSDLYILVVEIKQEVLSELLVNIDMGKTDNQMILNEAGVIVYSTMEDQIGETADIDLAPDSESNSDSKRYFGTNDEGTEQLIVLDKSQINDWYVVGSVNVEELVAGAKKISDITWIMALLAAILAILIGYVLARLFGKPLGHLRNLMQQGEQGDLSVRTNIRSKDEIGQLGESFNKMMEQISTLVKQTNISAQEVLSTAAELSDVSKRTAMSAREISVATEQIAGGASTLATEAERGSELTYTIKQEMGSVIESNFEMGKSANEVEKVSEQGIVYMSELINKTNSTEAMTRSMTDKVNNLRESTTSIRQILEVLNSISKQTNILSLNATIEAARAGAAGKGFMVVADEIRKLADQSKQSIEIVGQITEGIQNEVEETVNVLSEAYPIFKEQTDSVKEADLIFKNVQGQMGEFILHLDTVTNSIQQLEQSQLTLSEAMSSVSSVSQESSATSEEVASLSSEQLNVSEGLVDLSVKLESLSKSLEESLSRFST